MKALLLKYLSFLYSRKVSAATVKSIKYPLMHFVRYLETAAGIEKAFELTADELSGYQEKLTRHVTKKGLPMKTSGINQHIIAIRGFLRYLVQKGFLQAGIIDALPLLKQDKHLPVSVLSHSRMKRLLSKISAESTGGYRNRTLFELLYSCGLRVGEATSLDLSAIDFTRHTVMVTGKGGKQRVVPAGKTAMHYLTGYVRGIRPYLVKDPEEKALFLNKEGKRLSKDRVQTIIKKAARGLKFDVPVTPHTFRRSCATELIRGGANLYHVKEMLGHESLDTLKHYVRLTILDLKKTHKKCHPQEREDERA